MESWNIMRKLNKKIIEKSIVTIVAATAITIGLIEGARYIDKHREFITGTYIHLREHNAKYR